MIPPARTILMVLSLLLAPVQAWSIPAERHEIRAMVIEEAKRMGVSVSLALAVAHVESNFNPVARSHVGAMGVMQIMPKTGKEEYGINTRELKNPRINIRVGVHFLKRLLEKYNGHAKYALSHYNGGSATGEWPNVRVIPATRDYVRMVLAKQKEYDRQLKAGKERGWLAASGEPTRKKNTTEVAWLKDRE